MVTRSLLCLCSAALLIAACSLVNSPDEPQLGGPGGGAPTGSDTAGGGEGGGGATGGDGGGGASCPGDLTYCDGSCVDTQTSLDHCGGCDNDCGEDGECVAGSCECASPLIECDGSCIDPETDAGFCGAAGDCQGANAGTACDPQTEECTGGECSCLPSLVDCGGCIDPETDPQFCGASGDCQGANAGVDCTAPTASCEQGMCNDSCVNCSFETGDFTGWTTLDLSQPLIALAVATPGSDVYLFQSAPTDGGYSAINGYDGNGPGTIEIGQDITLGNVPSASLEFDYRCAWNNTGAQPRTFAVHVEPAGGGVPLQSNVLVTSAGGTSDDTAMVAGSADLTSFVGQTVHVHFVWTVPENYTGPGGAEIDNIRVTTP